MSKNSAHIQVVVRVKPAFCIESLSNESTKFRLLNAKTCELNAQRFSFDRVFGPQDNQETIFEERFKESVDNVLDGVNSSIIAYGQTAAGKSYTMTGGNTQETQGIIPRAIERIFANTLSPVHATFVELYNDKLQDLFNKRSPVTMQGDGSLKNAQVVDAVSEADLVHAVHHANVLRAVASTNLNSQSSRSHAVLQLKLGSQHNNAKLVLVDLAGSEKAAKTGTSGTKLGEAGNINKSLTVLAMVIQALSSRMSHVPYRDSKLTQLLRDSIGGNSKTVLIINCSPLAVHERESLSSLRFGSRAKLVENNIQSAEELESLAKTHYWQQKLKHEIQQYELYGSVPHEAWANLAELDSLEGFDSPKVHDPYEERLNQLENDEPTYSESMKAKQERIREFEQEIESLDKESTDFEAAVKKLQRRQSDVDDGAQKLLTMQIKRLKVAIDHYRERNHTLLMELAAAKSLTSEEKSRNYLIKINEECEHYVHLLTTEMIQRSQKMPIIKRASNEDTSMDRLKMRHTSKTKS